MIRDARVRVLFPEKHTLDETSVIAWIRKSGDSIAAWYGKFPVDRVAIQLELRRGRGVRFGRTTGLRKEPRIRLLIGRDSEPYDFDDDWVCPHEMAHLGFPILHWDRDWIAEGLASYVESVARVRSGDLSRRRFWSKLVRNLPIGQPRDGDRGLDYTETWARTYWGGALFYFLADLEILKRTNGGRGLEHAMRGLLAAGIDMRKRVSLERVFDLAKQGCGVDVLRELHEVHGDEPVTVDLDEIFAKLGIIGRRRIRFDDRAEWAHLRRRLETGRQEE